jgi:hypothetical protein
MELRGSRPLFDRTPKRENPMPIDSDVAHTLRARRVAEERASGESVPIAELPPESSFIRVLGVDYIHTVTEQGGDLYLTTAGFTYAEHLQPENWYDPPWFRSQREKLEGTGLVYAVPTKPIGGENLALVVKFSRVGEKVPIDTDLIENVLCCEFNGPFEEFALVEELRHSRCGCSESRIHTQVPLAIYVPPERTQLSQSGRFQWRVARKVAQHPGISIDIMREYLMVYNWLPGIDARQAQAMRFLTQQEARALTDRALEEIREKGFTMLDMKPEHVIVQVAAPHRLTANNGQIDYGLVDFELLERTAEYWNELKTARLEAYHRRKRELLEGEEKPTSSTGSLPSNLHAVNILGVDYIHGRAESTGGMLWIVGCDPELYEYFLPERWRTTPQIRFMEIHETYFTTSKDNIRFVWKVSRVGERPEVAAFGADGFRMLAYGFNSPFEKVAAAWWLRRRGIPAILPRAVYRTGHRSQLDESLFDPSRYHTHAHYRALDNEPILQPKRNYITIWDYWNGHVPVSEEEAPVGRSVNVDQAVERGLMNAHESSCLVADFKEKLENEGVEVFRLVPAHILLSIGPKQTLERDEKGRLRACLCNFQYLRLPSCR